MRVPLGSLGHGKGLGEGQLGRALGCLLAAMVLLIVWAGPASAETRVALVIGNSGYATRPLDNPRRDAALIAETLRGVGFDVTALSDADQATMKQAIIEFGRRLRGGDSVGLFYYAGHGVQVDGENYLIPTGVDIRDTEEVALMGVDLSEILKTMERAESRLNIVVLDACRDNPFAAPDRSLSRGLAAVEAPAGTLIAYATAPGRVAFDGTGDNSPYTASLAAAIPAEGSPIEDVFRRARRKVLEVTGGRQTPWEHSSLTGEFFFRPKSAAPETGLSESGPSQAPADNRLEELAAWEAIKQSTDPSDLKRHLAAYPDGVMSELAALKIATLEEKAKAWGWIFAPAADEAAQRTEAARLYEEAVKGDAPAASTAELERAAALYRQSADLGLPAAMHALARSYDKGRGVARDAGEAASWYRRAADAGHSGAMAALGTMFEFGEGVELDVVEATRLYRLAADAGDTGAMTSLGFLYQTGKGLPPDAVEARRWYLEAADRGNTRAMYNLALMSLSAAAERDGLVEAVRWLRAAAEKGHAGAMRELASLHDEGRGVARDPKRAATYLLDAYKAGHAQARSDVLERPDTWSFATRREIQRALAERGLYGGKAHGFFDTATRRALDRLAMHEP